MKNLMTIMIVAFMFALSLTSCGSDNKTTEPKPTNGGNYEVGKKGPAGGLVFYDKGSYSDGWRYLEAAPVSSEFNAEWGAYQKIVTGTQTEIGTGKANTKIIVAFLNSAGNKESGRAAQLCVALNIGGKKDWFLPSKDELSLMYQNLHTKGLGDFGKGKNSLTWMNWNYSSSSQHSNSSNNNWSQYFENGSPNYSSKAADNMIRAIRSF